MATNRLVEGDDVVDRDAHGFGRDAGLRDAARCAADRAEVAARLGYERQARLAKRLRAAENRARDA